ncbi:chalcone isomerase family protein [Photobacterium atrarenae]|uniref:Chalcone isomerase family protein n=1 Tax=Photobacterium atrarenae TaxID=865757 RepID=A0ABY5GLL0_9GAMM|nr:chalcone isomerase family protein [Photobacterium atrarenae]UTV30066.1 chalcone isomerase family protein [Photobacterium atrarenae]
MNRFIRTGWAHTKCTARFVVDHIVRRVLIVAGLLYWFQAAAMTPWQSWPTVGDATLTWGPWVIYDSELRTPSGQYQHGMEDLALVIKYQRQIDQEDLLEATDEQWQHLGIAAEKRQRWLARLADIWPDVRKGDRLIFVVNRDGGVFYQDNRIIGTVPDKEMSRSFIQIWLSPKTAYPKLRRQLIGIT